MDVVQFLPAKVLAGVGGVRKNEQVSSGKLPGNPVHQRGLC